MALYCSNCGNKLGEDVSFCPKCGERVYKEEKQEIIYYNNEPISNGFAIAGFILSFFVPLFGLIFSCVGLNKASYLNDNGKNLSIAGIVISAIFLIINLVAFIILFPYINKGWRYLFD